MDQFLFIIYATPTSLYYVDFTQKWIVGLAYKKVSRIKYNLVFLKSTLQLTYNLKKSNFGFKGKKLYKNGGKNGGKNG